MQKILLTGSNGLLGQKITALLAHSQDFKLIATSIGNNRNPQTNGYEYVSLDITNKQELTECLESHKPDYIINSAAMTNVDACESNVEFCYKINTEAVQNLVDYCKKSNCRLVHISTDFIFDGLDGPYREEGKPNPLSTYGNSKFEAEKIIIESGIPAAIARTIILYGVVLGSGRMNIVSWVKESLEKGTPIKVVHDQYRSPTLAEDLAAGIVELITRQKTGIYHLTGPEIMSIYDLACRVARFWKLDESLITAIDTKSFVQPAKRPLKTGFIILKAMQDIDYKPKSLEDGLAIIDKQLKNLS